MCVYTFRWTYIYIYIYIYMHPSKCMYIHTYIIYVYALIEMYIHTYIHNMYICIHRNVIYITNKYHVWLSPREVIQIQVSSQYLEYMMFVFVWSTWSQKCLPVSLFSQIFKWYLDNIFGSRTWFVGKKNTHKIIMILFSQFE